MEETTQATPAVAIPIENMNPTNQPVSFYGDNSRSTDGALLAALATKQPYEYDYAGMLGAGTGSDLRAEVGEIRGVVKDAASNIRSDIKDAESNIRSDVRQEGQEAVGATKDAECRIVNKIGDVEARVMVKLGDVECKIIKENSDQTLYLTNQLSVIREQGIRNEYETKLSREQTIKEIGAKIDHKAERAEDKLQALKDFTAEKFCHVEKKVDADFFALSTQIAKCCCEQELSAATQTGLLNVIANALNVGGIAVATHK